MRNAWAVGLREVQERRRVLLVASVIALLPFAVALGTGAEGSPRAIIGITGTILAIAFGLGTALVFGSTTLVKDVAERRLSFYLTRPLSPSTIWIGKAAGSLLVSASCLLVIGVPAWLAATPDWRGLWSMEGLLPTLAVGGLLCSFLLGHVLATIVRLRSHVLIVDLMLFLSACALFYAIARILIMGEALEELGYVSGGLALSLIMAAAIAPIWQIAAGRNDTAASHREFSRLFWTVLLVAFTSAGVFVAWTIPDSISDGSIIHLNQSPDGGAISVLVTREEPGDYTSTFMVDPKNGSEWRAPAALRNVVWSADGTMAAWTQPREFFPLDSSLELYRMGRDGRPVRTGIEASYSALIALSPTGMRVAVVENDSLTVHDLLSGKLVSSARVESDRDARAIFFVTDDEVRLYQQARRAPLLSRTMEVVALDVRKRTSQVTARVELPRATAIGVSQDGTRMLLRSTGVVADARTGETLQTVPLSSLSPHQSALIGDGSAAVVDNSGAHPLLRLYDREGNDRGTVPLPEVDLALISAETADGRLVIQGRGRAGFFDPRSGIYVVDVVRVRVASFTPGGVAPFGWADNDPRLPRLSDDALMAVRDRERELKLLDLKTGDLREIGKG